MRDCVLPDHAPANSCLGWHKPPPTFLKCNTDAAVFVDAASVGLSCVLRDETGNFVACRARRLLGLPPVRECEALALLDALKWVLELGYTKVIFETDAMSVVWAMDMLIS